MWHGLILLATLTVSTPDKVFAPDVPPWRGDLPQAEPRAEGGTYLPPPLDDEVLKRLLFLDRYPALCQDSIDTTARLGEMRAAAEHEEARGSWKLPAAIGVLTGIAAGYYFGHH